MSPKDSCKKHKSRNRDPAELRPKMMTSYMVCFGLHGGAAGSTAAMKQEGPGFESSFNLFLNGVRMSSPCIAGCSQGTPVSSQSLSMTVLVNGSLTCL